MINRGGIAINRYPKNIFNDGVNSSERLEDTNSTKVIENNGEITSPNTTNPPDINKTISNKSKSKGLNSFHLIVLEATRIHNALSARMEPIKIVKRGINLIAIILKNIFFENIFVINALSSKSNLLLNKW